MPRPKKQIDPVSDAIDAVLALTTDQRAELQRCLARIDERQTGGNAAVVVPRKRGRPRPVLPAEVE